MFQKLQKPQKVKPGLWSVSLAPVTSSSDVKYFARKKDAQYYFDHYDYGIEFTLIPVRHVKVFIFKWIKKPVYKVQGL